MVFPDKKDLFRKSLYSIGILSLVLLASCKDQDVVEEIKSDSLQEKKEEKTPNYRALFSTNHKIGEEEAMEMALDVASLFEEEENGLRSGKVRTVEGVRVLRSEQHTLRSGSNVEISIPDTLAYVINFAEGEGFAIIGADDRLDCPILACVDSGSLGDDTNNPGLAIFLNNAQVYMSRSILKFEMEKDSMLEVAKQKLALEDSIPSTELRRTFTGKYTYKTTKGVKPLLRTCWDQNEPYNRYTPICSASGKHTPTGCWAVAMAQVMAYHRFPPAFALKDVETNNPIVINWERMTATPKIGDLDDENAKKMIALLMKFIGKNAGMNYGCEGSTLQPTEAIMFMRALSYSCAPTDCNISSVMKYLNRNSPIMMRGAFYEQKEGKRVREGHAWVVDGYTITMVELYSYITNTETGKTSTSRLAVGYENPLLHINWGWNGSNNGYFAAGCFDISKAVHFDDSVSGHQWNYTADLTMVYALPPM